MQLESRPPLFALSVWLCIATGWVLSLPGCERQPTTVAGAVTVDHNRLSITPDMRGTISFQPRSGQGAVVTGLLSPTGEYEVSAGGSSEVSPGKYDVAISVVKLTPKSESGEQGAKRITAAKYDSAQSSGITAEIHSGPNVFNFNVSTSEDSPDTSTDSPSRSAPSKDSKSESSKNAEP
ncbi:MAG TPA: hypothetical protein VHU84_15800 [Lacipirellulaceae bacterium]|jgi:hypothetical protein|nr:hypothetical protein [Lacipirellulaceae bacterium]